MNTREHLPSSNLNTLCSYNCFRTVLRPKTCTTTRPTRTTQPQRISINSKPWGHFPGTDHGPINQGLLTVIYNIEQFILSLGWRQKRPHWVVHNGRPWLNNDGSTSFRSRRGVNPHTQPLQQPFLFPKFLDALPTFMWYPARRRRHCRQQPGWNIGKWLICYHYYKPGHASLGCNLPLNKIEKLVAFYEKLTFDEKTRVRDTNY